MPDPNPRFVSHSGGEVRGVRDTIDRMVGKLVKTGMSAAEAERRTIQAARRRSSRDDITR